MQHAGMFRIRWQSNWLVWVCHGLALCSFVHAEGNEEPAPALPVAEQQVAAPSIDELVTQLGDEKYRVRVQASDALWRIGKEASPALERALKEGGPEVRIRARELLRMIRLHVGPDTDPRIAKQVEVFLAAKEKDKQRAFRKLESLHAWRQMVMLYLEDKDASWKRPYREKIATYPLTGAREMILEGRLDDALDLLQLGQVFPENAPQLAAFCRQRGMLEAELARCADTGEKDHAWRMLLLRAKGDWQAAAQEAGAYGQKQTQACMQALAGDPVPWLTTCKWEEHYGTEYGKLALAHWNGVPISSAGISSLRKEKGSVGLQCSVLNALGLREDAMARLRRAAPFDAVDFFLSYERGDEALELLKIDPEKLVDAKWASVRLKRMADLDIEDQVEPEKDFAEMAYALTFLHSRGLDEVAWTAFGPPLLQLAESEDGENAVMGFFARLHTRNQALDPTLTKRFAAEWCKDDAARWKEITEVVCGDEKFIRDLEKWLNQIDGKLSGQALFEAIYVLSGMDDSDATLFDAWEQRLWKSIDAMQGKPHGKALDLMSEIGMRTGNNAILSQVFDRLDEEKKIIRTKSGYFLVLAAAGDWQTSLQYTLQVLEENAAKKFKTDAARRTHQAMIMHAWAAIALRKVGKVEQAAAHDRIAGLLVLGNPQNAREVAKFYMIAGERERAMLWSRNAVGSSEPGSEDFRNALKEYFSLVFAAEDWAGAASMGELYLALQVDHQRDATWDIVPQMRMKVDIARALSMRETSPEQAELRLLEACRDMDSGSLADDFFPSLDRSGMIALKERVFHEHWQQLSALIKRYPDAHNTLNTAAWMASRAVMNLDEALTLSRRSLQLRPHQAAYLDTMAEVHFALGDRDSALRFSRESLLNSGRSENLEQLFEQYEHFKQDPLP